MSTAICFFCNDLSIDPVALRVFEACRQHYPFQESGLMDTGDPALAHRDVAGNMLYLVQTEQVLSDALPKYLDRYGAALAQADLAGIVNWHEGTSAPNQIFCAHTNGDVVSGAFPTADARLATAVLRSLEHHRRQLSKLANWQTLPEATHCSGTMHGASKSDIMRCPCPFLDIEIGSTASNWQEPAAHEAMAHALVDIFRFVRSDDVPVLFVGGTHFEQSLQTAIFGTGEEGDRLSACGPTFAVGHILPNQWVATSNYEGEQGLDHLAAAAASYRQPVGVIGIHDGLKGPIKATARALAEQLGVPLLNHRRLRAGVGAMNATVREKEA